MTPHRARLTGSARCSVALSAIPPAAPPPSFPPAPSAPRNLLAALRRILREAAAELARINRAGLRPDALAGRPRRARARLVAAALTRLHRGTHRCC